MAYRGIRKGRRAPKRMVIRRNSKRTVTKARKFNRMARKPEINQTYGGNGTNQNGGIVYHRSNNNPDLPTGDYYANIVNWPAPGVQDTDRIGDEIIVKSCTYQMWIKLNLGCPQAAIRVIFFQIPDTLVGTGTLTSFWKFGDFNGPLMCSVNREKYNVISDKIHILTTAGTNLSPASAPLAQKSTTGFKLTRGTIMRPQKVVFNSGTTVVKYKRQEIHCVIIGDCPGWVEGTELARVQYGIKLNFRN